jgi:hypothetical protein
MLQDFSYNPCTRAFGERAQFTERLFGIEFWDAWTPVGLGSRSRLSCSIARCGGLGRN